MKIYLSPSSQPANLYSAGNTNEQIQCNRIAEYCKVALERCGFSVKKGPEGQHYKQNVTESNAWGADIHMPIHTNAGGGRGPRVFVYKSVEANTKFAAPVLDALNEIVPVKAKNGLSAQPGLYECNASKGICVYVEAAFHDNAQEAQWIINNVEAIGEAICKGICSGTGVKYVAPKANGTASTESASGAGAKSLYRVQVGAFAKKEHATKLQKQLIAAGFPAIIKTEKSEQ